MKGQFGHECARGACKTTPATAYNRSTEVYYCTPCGRQINLLVEKVGLDLCVEVSQEVSEDRARALREEYFGMRRA